MCFILENNGEGKPRGEKSLLRQVWGRDHGPVSSPRCRVRVIDTFGTEPAYNHEEYATLRGFRTNWGYWNLHPSQFMTMFRKLGTGTHGGNFGGS